MFRLTVVAGPNRGSSFSLSDGENTIGRIPGNTVVLPSTQVSKRHCVLVASNGQILLKDPGSSNGTFVNGVLTKNKVLREGDKISVGEYILEVAKAALPKRPSSLPSALPQVHGGGNVIPLHPMGSSAVGAPHLPPDPMQALGAAAAAGNVSGHAEPKDLKSKALWYFENYVMSIFYGMNLKNEWRMIGMVSFGAFLLINLVVSVQPLLNANTDSILRETRKRARFMAKQIAEHNGPYLAAGAETKAEIGPAETADGVRIAILTDLDQRIIAPSTKLNQYMVAGEESRFANRVAKKFRGGKETGEDGVVDDSTVVAVEPVKVFDQRQGRNVVAGMAVVAVDASLSMMGLGEAGVVYSETFVLTGIAGALFLLILYRLTLKPFQVLNEDMDKALKGEINQVTHEFKLEELNPLWDLINSAIQRIPKAGGKSGDGFGGGFGGDLGQESSPDAFIGPVRLFAEAANAGLVVFGADKKIAFLNPVFEELSGIRGDGATGQEISAVAREQSLGMLIDDLFGRAQPGGDGITEEYEFSGISCKVLCAAFGGPGESAKAYAVFVVRKTE